MRKRIALFAVPLVALTGCLLALPNGSGIRLSMDAVPASEMPSEIPGHMDQAEEMILSVGEIAMGGASPVVGALLYQFVLRPLRKRREDRKGKNKKVSDA